MTLIMEVKTHSNKDATPLQMISRERLDYYHRLEAAINALVEALKSAPAPE